MEARVFPTLGIRRTGTPSASMEGSIPMYVIWACGSNWNALELCLPRFKQFPAALTKPTFLIHKLTVLQILNLGNADTI
jgi:hypothetical protein